MDQWIRVQCGFDGHPDVMQLDHVGRAVLQHLWRKAKTEKPEGRLSHKYLTSRYLARACGIECPHCIGQIDSQVELLFELELLENEDKHFNIANWNKYQTDNSNRDRQRRFREKKRQEKYQNTLQRNVTVTPDNVSRTLCNALQYSTVQKKEETSPEVCGTLSGQAEPKGDELRDDRAIAFYAAMESTPIIVRGKGRLAVAESVKHPERLANNFSDESVYPGLSETFIKRAANWIDANPKRAKSDVGKFLYAWAAREKPNACANNRPRKVLE